MGAVYEVQDIVSGEALALKVMLTQEPRQLLRFKQEFRVVAELHHPNLVRLFDLACEDEQWFFTMEFVEGLPLLEALGYQEQQDELTLPQRPREALTPNELREAPPVPRQERGPACDLTRLVSMLGQVLDALEYLHARRIVHRDLKPSNILVSEGDKVRLLDFGLASRVDRGLTPSSDGTTVGTLAYMSPEQCEGSPATEASDLYSLGCMMFQLLTGKLPFGGNAAQLVQARLSRRPPRVERRVSGVPSALADICYQLLSRRPQQRPSISAVRQALGLQASTAVEPTEERADFVGRQAERKTLEAALDLALEGDISLALVSGESGIGKSTLASVLAQRAQQLNFVCLRGRCYERELLPFVALDRAVDSLILLLSQWKADELAPLSPLLESLHPIFPAIGALPASSRAKFSPTRSLDPRELYQRAIDGFCALLFQLQKKQPLLLVLDDLQWADRESIDLLEALLSKQQGRIFLLGLFRPEGLKEEHPLQRLLRLTQAPSRHLLLHLSNLSASEATQVIESTAGEQLDEATTALLVQQTKGNPFLAVQMASYLSSLPPEERRARLQREHQEEWLTSLLTSLSPQAAQVLSVAAVAGGDISRSLLHETSALSNEDFNLALGELISVKLCKALPSKELHDAQPLQRLDIYHDRLREAAYDRLSPPQKQALHRDFALALEARPRGKERDAELLLLHWTAAQDPEKQHLFTIEAAEQAIEKLAFQRAIELLERLLQAPGQRLEETIYRWERLGDLCEYRGQLLKASAAYQEALSLSASLPASPTQRAALLRLRGRVGENLLSTGKISQGRDAYAAGLSLMGLSLQKTFARQAASLLWLQALLFFKKIFPGRQKTPTNFEEEQIKFFSQMIRAMVPFWPIQGLEASLRCELLGMKFNDKQVLLRAVVTKASLFTFLKRPTLAQLQQAHLLLDDAQKLAHEYGLPFGKELVQMNRGMLLMHSDLSLAKQENKAAQESLARGGLTEFYDNVVARMYYIVILFLQGDHDEALEQIERELKPEQPYFTNTLASLGYQAHILAQLGRYQEAEAANARGEALLRGTPLCFLTLHSKLALDDIRFSQGHFQEAFDSTLSALPLLQKLGISTSVFYRGFWHEALLNAAEGLARNGQLSPSQAKKAKACALDMARHGIFDYPCVGFRFLAVLAHLEGDAQTAHRHLQAALRVSSPDTNPYRRLLCLEAARLLNALTPLLEAEVTHLTTNRRLVRPTGWNQ